MARDRPARGVARCRARGVRREREDGPGAARRDAPPTVSEDVFPVALSAPARRRARGRRAIQRPLNARRERSCGHPPPSGGRPQTRRRVARRRGRAMGALAPAARATRRRRSRGVARLAPALAPRSRSSLPPSLSSRTRRTRPPADPRRERDRGRGALAHRAHGGGGRARPRARALHPARGQRAVLGDEPRARLRRRRRDRFFLLPPGRRARSRSVRQPHERTCLGRSDRRRGADRGLRARRRSPRSAPTTADLELVLPDGRGATSTSGPQADQSPPPTPRTPRSWTSTRSPPGLRRGRPHPRRARERHPAHHGARPQRHRDPHPDAPGTTRARTVADGAATASALTNATAMCSHRPVAAVTNEDGGDRGSKTGDGARLRSTRLV